MGKFHKKSNYKVRGKRQRTDKAGFMVSCSGKVRYDTKAAAKTAAESHDYDYKGDGRRMRGYRCAFKSPNGSTHFHFGREPAKS